MRKEHILTREQLTKLKEAQKETNEATQEANIKIELAKNKQKAFSDLVEMVCSLLGFDKEKTQLNIETGVLSQEIEDKIKKDL
jgi:hypothetical protein